MSNPHPFKPVNGRILVKQLPYVPSKIIEAAGVIDKAFENEGIVVAVSDYRFGRKRFKGGWEHTGDTFPHEVKAGDRVIFPGSYQDDDVQFINGEKHRYLESWDIQAIIDAPQPTNLEHPVTGAPLARTPILQMV